MHDELPRRVSARAGFEWVTGAFRLFFKNPLVLAVAAGISMGALLILQFIPVVGPGLSEILTPLIVAGFMRAFRTIDEGDDPELPQLLAGFRENALPLAIVGSIYLAILIAILFLMKQLGVDYEALLNNLQHRARPEDIAAQFEGKLPLLLLASALVIPAIAATWYAPALILFGNAQPLQAMGLSLKACLRNWAALLINGFGMIPVLLLALIPLFGMMIVIPVMLGTAYLGYQAMFASKN
ncbi:MAG: hypothetical protein HXY27_04720 [Hydrogenophilaceae bacterium]|jgi:uncharacterized membrane protein|nr:hypothetical protein [Hydrogenophilaceae bacterium]